MKQPLPLVTAQCLTRFAEPRPQGAVLTFLPRQTTSDHGNSDAILCGGRRSANSGCQDLVEAFLSIVCSREILCSMEKLFAMYVLPHSPSFCASEG